MALFPWSSLSSALPPWLTSASPWRQDDRSSWPHIQNSRVQRLFPRQSLDNKDLPQRLPENPSFCLISLNRRHPGHSEPSPGKRLWLPLVRWALPWSEWTWEARTSFPWGARASWWKRGCQVELGVLRGRRKSEQMLGRQEATPLFGARSHSSYPSDILLICELISPVSR